MVKIVTNRSVTYGKPFVGQNGKVAQTKIKYGRREVLVDDIEHIRHPADAVIDVDEEFAAELLAKGFARKVEAALDGVEEVDPTKSSTEEALG